MISSISRVPPRGNGFYGASQRPTKDSIRWNILRRNSASTYHHILSDGDTIQYYIPICNLDIIRYSDV